MKRRTAIFVGVAILALWSYIRWPNSGDDMERFIQACGMPDHDDSTLYDNPIPYFVSRAIDYDRAHLSIFLVLSKSGNADWPTCLLTNTLSLSCKPEPPYEWKVIGYFNMNRWHPLGYGGDGILRYPDKALARVRQACTPGFVPPTPMPLKAHYR
jgi:hypothetical protein